MNILKGAVHHRLLYIITIIIIGKGPHFTFRPKRLWYQILVGIWTLLWEPELFQDLPLHAERTKVHGCNLLLRGSVSLLLQIHKWCHWRTITAIWRSQNCMTSTNQRTKHSTDFWQISVLMNEKLKIIFKSVATMFLKQMQHGTIRYLQDCFLNDWTRNTIIKGDHEYMLTNDIKMDGEVVKANAIVHKLQEKKKAGWHRQAREMDLREWYHFESQNCMIVKTFTGVSFDARQ